MRFTPSLLAAALYSTSVAAFFPLKLDADINARDISNDGAVTLDVRRAPVRRDNLFKSIKADKPTATNSTGIDQDGKDYSYFAVAQIGSEKQEMWMLLDTGGSNTWIFSSQCTDEPCQQHRTFTESKSDTLNMSSVSWNVGYGTGTVNGVLGDDTLSIAGLEVTMALGLAKEASDDFMSYPMDGILGLSRSNDTGYDSPTFMDVVEKAGLLQSNIIGFSLSRGDDGGKDGSITFGGVDEDKLSGNVTYTDTVSSSNRWSIPVDDVTVDGTACNFTDRSAIIDTGTSYAMMTPDDAKTLHDMIPGSSKSGSKYLVPCDSDAELRVIFSGVSYAISPKDYVGEKSGSDCASNIIAQQSFGENVWLLGDVFLKNVYSVFDYDNNKIGFAGRKGMTDPVVTSEDSNQDTVDASKVGGTGDGSDSSSSSSPSSSESDSPSSTSSSSSSSSTADEKSSATIITPQLCWPALLVMLGFIYS